MIHSMGIDRGCEHKYKIKFDYMGEKSRVPYLVCEKCSLIRWFEIPKYIPKEQKHMWATRMAEKVVSKKEIEI